MNDDFIKHALTYGKEGKRWLKQIPEIIKIYEKKWSLKVLSPYVLTYNYVAPAIRNDGSKTVLKIGLSQDREFQTEISALQLFNGDGSAKIIDADKENAVILIEQVVPGISLSTMQDDVKSTKILASVMKRLWKPLPQNHSFITIKEWTRGLSEYPIRFKNSRKPPVPFNLVEKATYLFRELIATSAPAVLTHGDLHHDNVLTSDRDGWLAIDPKGVAAEPAHETAAMMRNPYTLIKNVRDIDNLLLNRIKILSEELHIDPKRIHKWGFAQTVLSGVWTSDNPKYTTHALKVIQALDRIKI